MRASRCGRGSHRRREHGLVRRAAGWQARIPTLSAFSPTSIAKRPDGIGAARAVVIGAGGAARAIVWALRQRGFEDIRIVNRTKARAEELAAAFPPASRSRPRGIEPGSARRQVHRQYLDAGHERRAAAQRRSFRRGCWMPRSAILSIHPLETDLLSEARSRGLRAVDGLGMLLHQAVPGFEIWFGVRPEVTPELREAVLAAIEAREKAHT